MQKLAEICIRRPVFATMIVLSLVVVGAASAATVFDAGLAAGLASTAGRGSGVCRLCARYPPTPAAATQATASARNATGVRETGFGGRVGDWLGGWVVTSLSSARRQTCRVGLRVARGMPMASRHP